ncbi:polysaccharide transporter [Bradyrhizobium erythrophlei]|uniref:Membrane protein involved in the export of O-antigen and teichoic acid n=1 Tax=Bradyrhizobium erythrophlei TaxID=1437360 RepID=A0A1H5IV62_9BRAD|nr:polysaccharide transporter [Bradyrhizobium erythrophlei]SEE44163.1 Membrane protein involved in the export of O-antigen and teichoic acid [Bradyrhizobium erythrophlei]
MAAQTRVAGAARGALRRLRRAGGNVALGLIDQALLSGSAFVLTIVLANVLDINSFGQFSIAWSFSILIEAVFLRGLFDDGLPATAHRIPKSLWPQLRLGLYLSSLLVSAVLGLLLVIAGLVIVAVGGVAGGLVIATGLAIPAVRLQSMFRRICYLDGRLPRAVVSSLTYCAALVVSAGLMITLKMTGAAAAMACIAISAALAGSLLLAHTHELAWPQTRIFRGSLQRLFRNGRWFVATSLTYWIGSIGLIPVCGFLIGLDASASLRILLLVFAPLSQFCATMFSVRLPEIAAELRAGRRSAVAAAARENAVLLGSIALAYGAMVVLLGQRMLALVIHGQSYEIGTGSIALMGTAMALDAVWLGLALPLFATGRPQRFMLSRIAGLVALCCVLPLAAEAWQVMGAVAAMVASSAASVIVVVLTNSVREQI